MKYVLINTLFLMFVFHTSCGQNPTNVPQDNISKGHYSESQLKEAATSKVPMSMVRNVKQDRNPVPEEYELAVKISGRATGISPVVFPSSKNSLKNHSLHLSRLLKTFASDSGDIYWIS